MEPSRVTNFQFHRGVLAFTITASALILSCNANALTTIHRLQASADRVTHQECSNGIVSLHIDNEQHQLIALHQADKRVIRKISLVNTQGISATVRSLHHAIKRQSCIAVLHDGTEIWEMSYDEKAEPVYKGWVHDYQMKEGIADNALFAPRISLLDYPMHQIIFDSDFTHAIGVDLTGRLQIINLNIRRKIVEFYFPTAVDLSTAQIIPGTDGEVLQCWTHAKDVDERVSVNINIRRGKIIPTP